MEAKQHAPDVASAIETFQFCVRGQYLTLGGDTQCHVLSVRLDFAIRHFRYWRLSSSGNGRAAALRGEFGRRRAKLLGSQRASVNLHSLQSGQIDTFEAAHVDRHRIGAGLGMLAEAEGCATAGRAELMPDAVRVEGVGGHVGFRRGQGQRLAWQKPQQVALATAMRTIALDGLVRLGLDPVTNLSTMTTALELHDLPPCVENQ